MAFGGDTMMSKVVELMRPSGVISNCLRAMPALLLTRTSYRPGRKGKSGTRKKPASSVLRVASSVPSESKTVMVAAGTLFPEESRTVPVKET
jgi:hypothetical protein